MIEKDDIVKALTETLDAIQAAPQTPHLLAVASLINIALGLLS